MHPLPNQTKALLVYLLPRKLVLIIKRNDVDSKNMLFFIFYAENQCYALAV